ncbi:MAG: tripartite tricarboxylate transporter substrate binding protein [Reyranella sp.]|uniref:Bug family tripartite tricarboxylate transporter substrate binding protein n=1 Tax=Reyranella sp. TaxID=1929291 RepID=UPI001AC2DD69|nr:tripartite tricarboxylate transporter substrate binding protein [Reyranella sp.]MBN9088006.1 tripartite tricarboxylate transporter substrate binding protein [Reyranella sp.]
MISRRSFARTLVAAPMAVAASGTAFGQDDYPNRTLQLVVGFPAGQASDIGARLMARQMAEELKQSVYVDNKPGATGIIAHQFVKGAAPDGYTFLFGSTATLAINPSLFRKLPYDPLKDFAPVALLWVSPMFLVAAPDLPVNSFGEAVAYAKAHPGKTAYGSGGSGSTQHIAMELLKKELGLDMMHVPYKGTPGMLNDLMAGRIDFAFESASSIVPYIQAKSVKVLATSVAARLPIMPDVPTIAEQGLPGFEAVTWAAFVAPAGTSAPVVARLNEAANKGLASKDMTENFAKTYAQPRPGTPAELEAFLRKEIDKWGKAVAASGAQVD